MSLSKFDLWLRGFSPTARYEGEGDMKREHLEGLVDCAKAVYEEHSNEERLPQIDAGERELNDMLTPITAEALLADGWTQNNRQFQKRNGMYVYPFSDPPIVTIRNKHAKGVKSMHDLRELQRLIMGDE